MRNDNEMIDVGPALQASHVGPLHGRPYPVQFRSQGAFDAWRNVVGGTSIWTRWIQPHATCGDITPEMLWQQRKRPKLAQRAASLYNGIVVGPESLPSRVG